MVESTSKCLMQVLFIERVNLFSEIWPVETPSQLLAEAFLITGGALLGKLDFPADEVV